MRLRLSLTGFFCILSLLSTFSAPAVLLPGYTTGSGEHTAQLVVDFGFIDADAYLFEYHFDGSATTQDMLLALDAAGDLTVHHQFYDFGNGPSIFVDGFSYAGLSSVPGFEGDAGENWSFYLVDPRSAAPIPWVGSPTGPTDRVLQDGAVDGWSLNISPFNSQGLDPTYNTPPLPSAVLTPGDPDGDGDIDDADLGTAFANYTGPVDAAGGKTVDHGDTDNDGDVDDTDLGTMFAGYSGPLAPNSVPEPASALMLMLGLTVLARRKRH